MQLPGDQVQGVIKLLWCELCCGFGILFIFSHAVVFMVSKLGQQQTGWVGEGERAKSALWPLACSRSLSRSEVSAMLHTKA